MPQNVKSVLAFEASGCRGLLSWVRDGSKLHQNCFTSKSISRILPISASITASKILQVKWWRTKARFIESMQIAVSNTRCDRNAHFTKAKLTSIMEQLASSNAVMSQTLFRRLWSAQLRTAGHRYWAVNHTASFNFWAFFLRHEFFKIFSCFSTFQTFLKSWVSRDFLSVPSRI